MIEAPNAGDQAPDFTIQTHPSGQKSLSDYRGKKLVLYFYPKDNTPGCTTQAIDFTTDLNKFEAANAEILGVSRDSLKKHSNFTEKHTLKIELGSDEDGTVCNAYGVWVEKKNYGKTYMGIERSTFLIDETGKISKTWKKVRVKGHVEAVLNELTVT